MTNNLKSACIREKDGLTEALSIFINQIVYTMKSAGENVTTLSLGEAFFDIPQFDEKELDFRKGMHYCDSRGIPGLRDKISALYRDEYGIDTDPAAQILVSAGSKAVIFMIMMALLEKGGEVLVPEPAWLSYPEHIRLAGGIPVFIPHDVPVSEYSRFITGRTKMIIINDPNNPGGKRYSREELEDISRMCSENDMFVVSDEAYSNFVPEGSRFISAADSDRELANTIIVNSLSKNFGLSGWRIGYMIARKDIVDEVLKYQQHIITCSPTYLQMYAERYFDDLVKITAPQIKAVMDKRRRTESAMREKGISFMPGDSTFYFLIDCGKYSLDKMKLCLYLLFRYRIAAVPGEAYGQSVRDYIRIGIGTASDEELSYALDIIKKVVDTNEFDENVITDHAARLGISITNYI